MEKVPLDLDNLSLVPSRFSVACTTAPEQNNQNRQASRTKLKHSMTINSITSTTGCDSRQLSARSIVSTVVNKKSSDNSLFLEMVVFLYLI